jgi:hypothetical protein
VYSDQQAKDEQAKRISELEATNEKMRNMLLAVKSHLAAQRDAERRRPPTGEYSSRHVFALLPLACGPPLPVWLAERGNLFFFFFFFFLSFFFFFFF